MTIDGFLERFNLKYEQLTIAEKDTLTQLYENIQKSQITVPTVKEAIDQMREGVERALVETDEFDYFFFGLFKRANRKHLILKARLWNYLVLSDMLSAPDRAKMALESALSGYKG
jgi:hypothetical protein